MPSLSVYLGDSGSGLTSDEKNSVQSRLQSWFGQIVPRGTTAVVSWTSSVPASILDTDLLVYFVASSLDSVVGSLPGGPQRSGNDDGFTAWSGSLTASEVYVGTSRRSGCLAEVAFHELMHNKLHLDGNALHSRDGLASGSVNAGMNPSPQNIAQMRAALRNRHRQWTGGWAITAAAASGDPLAGIIN